MIPTRARAVDRFFDFSLLGLLASGYFAVAGSGYLDAPTIVLVGAGLVLRALLVAGAARLSLSDRWVTAATVAYIGFYPLDYLYVSGEFIPATVHLVFFVAIARLLTAKTDRDYLYVKVIAFLELLAASILSTNLNFFFFLGLFVLFGVATFASSEIRRSAHHGRRVSRAGLKSFGWRLSALSLVVALGILALTSGMFFVLPRTARAAFRHLAPERFHLPGFSNEVTLGQIGELKQNNMAVMHVRVYSGQGPMDLKWRGAALGHFDGRKWSNPRTERQVLRVESNPLMLADDRQRLRAGGVRIGYEVRVQAVGSDALFFAGIPEAMHIAAPLIIRGAGDSYRVGFGGSDGLHYVAFSYLPRVDDMFKADALPAAQRKAYLELPTLDPRIGALARDVTVGEISDEERARAIEKHLRQRYAYTTELPSVEAPDPVANFLFHRRKGHCEYFASAMTVMLRSLGIPSRVVTGFQSGVLNPLSGWYVVRASDAHSWVEAWLPRKGWTTFDPTPPDPHATRLSLWTKVGLYLDAAETFWQDWVLNYDIEQQVMLAQRMEESSHRFRLRWSDRVGEALRAWTDRGRNLASQYSRVLLMALVAFIGAWLAAPRLLSWWKTRRRLLRVRRGLAHASDATLLYERMLALLRRRGLEKPAWVTPEEFAALVADPKMSAVVRDFTAAYNELRFGGDRARAPRMVEMLGAIEKL